MSKPAEVETVTVTRKQFNAMRLAVLQYESECKSHARDCARAGLSDMANVWAKDADEWRALYRETEGK